ncbi:POU domain, class 4, transcription factor 3 [Corvus kubaryi]|uniref:POU domain, class 4, transcription factor 3 n=1 Tax=Corvus kubaryi TaxID=68294 RepID=UPI001C04889A|nr:POU domain, class 4, transcription factor 3 [Corvus kubaryi]
MMAMDAKQPFAVPAALQDPKFPSLHAGAEAMRRVCLPAPQLQGNIFGSFDESLLARAEALAAADIAPHAKAHHLHPHFKPDAAFHAMSGVPCAAAALPHPAALTAHPHPLPHPALDGGDLLEHLSPSLAVAGLAEPPALPAPLPPPPLPGAALSQSTICRFESLTLSHNNMTALRPVLQAWLEGAEAARRARPAGPDPPPGAERKRRRTSIAAPERRSLEAYFALQPRPSAEKIAAIAEKLDLKKNVVRVWFCNQRQKQKRMKYSAVH